MEKAPYLDVALLCDTIQSIDEVWESWGTDPPLTVRERMIGLFYEKFLRNGKVDRETTETYLRLKG